MTLKEHIIAGFEGEVPLEHQMIIEHLSDTAQREIVMGAGAKKLTLRSAFWKMYCDYQDAKGLPRVYTEEDFYTQLPLHAPSDIVEVTVGDDIYWTGLSIRA